MIHFFCTLCGQPMVASEARAGTTATCPACKGIVTVPAAAGAMVQADAPVPTAPLAGPPPVPSRVVPEMIPPPVRKKKSLEPWWLLLLFLSVGVAAVVSSSTVHLTKEATPPPGMSPAARHAASVTAVAIAHFAEILILAFVPALIIAVICRFTIRSFGRPLVIAFTAGMLSWSLVFLSVPSLTASHTGGIAGNDAPPSKEFEKRVEQTANEILESKKVPKSPATTLPPKPAGSVASDLDRWNEVCREASAEGAVILPDYDKELREIGFKELLVADRLFADKDFTKSREIIEASQRAVRHTQQRLKDFFMGVRKKVADLHLSAEDDAEARRALERTVGKVSGPLQEYLDVEEKIVGLHAETARYLDFVRPYWSVVDHKAIYQRKPDFEHVRDLAQQIKDGRTRQDEIKKEMATVMATIIEQQKDRQGGK